MSETNPNGGKTMRKLAVEGLEPKRLLAVNVVEFDNGIAEPGEIIYNGMRDTYIRRADPGLEFTHTDVLLVGRGNNQTQIGFTAVFGDDFMGTNFRLPDSEAPGWQAKRTHIISANLAVHHEPGSTAPFDMKAVLFRSRPWDEPTADNMWTNPSVDDGVTGFILGTTPSPSETWPEIFDCVQQQGRRYFCDVTDAVQSAVDGHRTISSADHGLYFGLYSEGGNTFRLVSQDAGIPDEDPELIVTYDDDVYWSDVDRLFGDGDASDVDRLYDAIYGRNNAPQNSWTDLNGDGSWDQADVDMWVRDIMHTEYGDYNLDGNIDASDDGARLLFELNNSGLHGWATCDFTGDEECDASGDGGLVLANMGFDRFTTYGHV